MHQESEIRVIARAEFALELICSQWQGVTPEN